MWHTYLPKLGRDGTMLQKRSKLLQAVSLLCWLMIPVPAQEAARRVRVGVLGFAGKGVGRVAAESLAMAMAQDKILSVNDIDESEAAARGLSYAGMMNLSLEEARDLGGALGCDFYFLGRIVTEELSDVARPKYGAAYLALVLVSARTGRLVLWQEVRAEAATPAEAAKQLPELLANHAQAYVEASKTAQAQEQAAERQRLTTETPPLLIPDAPETDTPAAKGLRLPAPYRRLTPAYPETAARVQAAGTVDALVELDAQGEVRNVTIVRWAGFGLDEAVADTVRRMHFRPAQRDGVGVPLRVLLRYNFRPVRE